LAIGSDVQAHSAVLDATTASFTTADETKLDGIEAGADVTDAVNVAAAGAPIITSGAGAPVSTPATVGDIYIDTTADEAYVATDTASSADWDQISGGAGTPTSLSTGTVTATTYGITSDGGADDVVLVEATTAAAGLLGAAKWDEIVANTAKVSNATHTGDVTGSTALTLESVALTGKTLVTAVGTDHVLIADASDAGNLKKALISDFASAGGDMAAATYDPAGIGEQLVGTTATQTITNKTLTEPKLADLGFIADANGNELIVGDTVASAVNEITVSNAATAGDPTIAATGDDTDVNLHLTPKGAGEVWVDNSVRIQHTALKADDHALEIDIDAAGFGDVKALDIVYDTGALSSGEEEAVMLSSINQIDATGGSLIGHEILATDGGLGAIYGQKAGAGVGPIIQESGTFSNPTTGTNNTTSTNVANMIDGSAGTSTTIFVADNDYIIIGAGAEFTEIEFIIQTSAGNPGIDPTFAYSTVGAGQFTAFTPVDGTNGFQSTGVVAWEAADLTGHTTNDDTGTYDIKITRTSNSKGNVSLFYAKTAATVVYSWDKDGVITSSNVSGTNTGDNTTATPTSEGIVELATIAETDTGTDTSRVITPAVLAGSALQTKVDGIEALADVTDTANVTAAGALMDSEVDADIKTLALPANTTISAFGATLVDDVDAPTARTTLGVDAAGTDNSTDVTLSGTGTYISIIGQAITVDPITESDISDLGTYSTATGVENNADVTDTANVTAAGALMDSEVTNLAQVKAFNSADYATAAQGTTADAALPKAGGAVTGPITTTSTFDGRDVATDGTKLDGIEALADVTDATNVGAALTLTGDVTSSGSMVTTIANDAVDIAMLSATGAPSSSTYLRGDNTWATPAGGGGSGVAISEDVTQTAHGFNVNDIIYHNGTDWQLATANTEASAESLGVVETDTDANNFTVNLGGKFTGTGFAAGTTYFLSDTTAGLLTSTEPTAVGSISKPVFYAISTTVGYVLNYRGMEIAPAVVDGGSPEGTAVLSTGETGGTKYLREDGDGTCSWQTVAGGGDALVANPLSQFAATTSAQLAGVLSDETGTGAAVFATSPTFVTPALGTPSSGVATNLTGTAAGLTAGATTGVEAGADVTDTANVTAAGALMDSECTSLADVKALNQSLVSGAAPTFTNTNFTPATNKNYVTDAEQTVIGNTSGINSGDSTLSRSVTIVDPVATDDATLFFTPVAITITDVRSHITGTTNVVFNIGHAATRTGTQLDVFTSDITLTSTAGQSNASGFSDATIPANSWVWLEVVSVSGTPTFFHSTVIYTED
jgi:hypothetical protein